jgi:hypothetical protein
VYCCVYVVLFKAKLNLHKVEAGAVHPLKLVAAQSLYSIGPGSYMQAWGPIGGPKVVDAILQ